MPRFWWLPETTEEKKHRELQDRYKGGMETPEERAFSQGGKHEAFHAHLHEMIQQAKAAGDTEVEPKG